MATPVPTSRLARMTGMARAGARRLLRGDDSGEDLAAILGGLRGFGTKLGQMASYVDGLIPAGGDDDWERALGALRDQAPASPPDDVRRAVEVELRAPITQLFSAWEPTPLASGSIGQVHRATLPDGTPVAVKVQHPGIARAIESDLSNMTLIEAAASVLGARRVHSRQILDEIALRLRDELDYHVEAATQERFRALHAHDPQITIPAVIPSHSTRRVLTTTFATGLSFDEACAAPEADRAAWCATLWRFVHRGTITAGLFNADPHPGNYLFQPDGRVVFLDFGCAQVVDEAFRAADAAIHRAAVARDEEAFAAAVRSLLNLRGGVHEPLVQRQLRMLYEPLFSSPFRVTRPFAAGLWTQVRTVTRETWRSGEQIPPLPQGAFFLNRLQFGFYSVLARLDASVDYAAIERELLAQGPP
jgi:predicted unusual protein kinase regulating ubiquinone biosynthesis (AarF/ABC1/UbiB family)